ncbi:response regulator [Kineococcus gynurae]|uniref:Response regulator n=1 Tax=Kineococcus gynurae TaxID=452979 RepID=A0ABV5LR59_9ACTN
MQDAGGEPVRVLVVDDEHLVRSGITAILSSAPDITVVAATDGIGAAEALARHPVDVVLLDIRMPVADGLSVLASVTETAVAGARPAVAMLTTFHADEKVAAALAAGANGYLLKDTDPDLLIQHVRALASGAAVLSSGVTASVVEGFLRSRSAVDPGAAHRIAQLSPREREVLQHLARGAPNSEIAAEMHLSLPTVKEHVGSVLTKLRVANRVQAAVLAVRSGHLEAR